MRIIAGSVGGRRLVSPRGMGTRPMTDRAREALFSSLGPAAVAGARVLDLYAGSGTLGLEALSRGAVSAVLVERDPEALRALRANVAALDVGGRVVSADVDAYLQGTAGPFDLAFLDPPYALSLPSVEKVLASVVPMLAPGATVILHRPAGEDGPQVPDSLSLVDRRTYGGTGLWRFVREKAEEES